MISYSEGSGVQSEWRPEGQVFLQLFSPRLHDARFFMSALTAVTVSVATTRFYNHVIVLFIYDIWVVVEIKDRDNIQGCGRAARLGQFSSWLHKMDERLHNGVVRSVHSCIQGKSAFSVAVIGRVALGSNDPILKTRIACSSTAQNKVI